MKKKQKKRSKVAEFQIRQYENPEAYMILSKDGSESVGENFTFEDRKAMWDKLPMREVEEADNEV